jgi:hypothetical protein
MLWKKQRALEKALVLLPPQTVCEQRVCEEAVRGSRGYFSQPLLLESCESPKAKAALPLTFRLSIA